MTGRDVEMAMRDRLTDQERSELVASAGSVVPMANIVSICAYGPRVAGYGDETSLLIITRNDTGPRRQPAKAATPSSPVVIDEKAVHAAADGTAPDELLMSRLLNVYHPLLNPELLRTVENRYKKRVIAEQLVQLQADYGDLSPDLILPLEFFLFSKLHDLALAYPDQVDGYVGTYRSDRKLENLEAALDAFREAARALVSEGIVSEQNGSLRVFRDRGRRRQALSLLAKMHPQSPAGAAKNALRAFARAIGLSSRTKPIPGTAIKGDVGTLIELARPRKLLRLDEGVVFDDASKLVEELAWIYGFLGVYEHKEEKLGDITNSSSKLEIWGDGKRVKFILKPFPQLRSVKWFLLNLWAMTAKRFNMTPLSRLDREVAGVRRLHQLGIRTHRIAGVVLDERTLVTEYTEGKALDKIVLDVAAGKSADVSQIEAYARTLAKMHRGGLVYGDTKPANALVGEDGIYLLDLEQTEEGGDQAWDLAEFLYYSGRTAKTQTGMKLVADSFLAAYQAENGSRIIAKARRLRYLSPFLLFTAPGMSGVVRRSLKEHARSPRPERLTHGMER